jgi:hypothetical protein
MDTVNENSTRDIKISFTNHLGNPVTPDRCLYKLTDLESLTEIVEETEFIPENPDYTITIEADENIILNADNEYEERVLTIKWFYNNGNREENEEYHFRVKNLIGVEKDEFS